MVVVVVVVAVVVVAVVVVVVVVAVAVVVVVVVVVCLSTYPKLSIYLSFFLSICLSLFICLSVCLSTHLSTCLSASLKTKLLCETSSVFELDSIKNAAIQRDFLQKWKVECRADGLVPMRFAIFPLHLSKVLRLPRKSDARSYEVLHLSRNPHPPL